MNTVEFIRFEETPELKSLGVGIIKYGEIVLKYRVMEGKNGHGYFIVPPSYKVTDEFGEDEWKNWFIIDSRLIENDIIDIVKKGVNHYFKNKQAKAMPQNVYSAETESNGFNEFAPQSVAESQLPF